MSRRLLDHDPESKQSIYHSYDDHTRTTTLETVQDVEPWLEANKALANDPSYKQQGMKTGWWHVATIPIGVQYKWMKDHGVDLFNKDHQSGVKRLLNDPDYRYLRSSTGRV